MSAHPSDSSSSSRRRPPPQTLDPETAHERHQRIYRLKQAYEHGRAPPSKPTRTELDVIKERHQFIHDGNVDPANLSWEDQLALQYYNSLFREYALVNLKHYRTGQIALRWRTEPEVLFGIGHLTCGSLRCSFHQPSSSLSLSASSPSSSSYTPSAAPLPEDDDRPLVPIALHETSMQFGYVEDGERKSALVKVVLCGKCAGRLAEGRERARAGRKGAVVPARGGRGEEDAGRREESEERRRRRRRSRHEEQVEEERDRRRRRRTRQEQEEERGGRRRARSTAVEEKQDDGGEESDYGPALPPDLEQPKREQSRSGRRSASPERERERERERRRSRSER